MRGLDLYQGLGQPENSNPNTDSNGDSLLNSINKYLSPIPEGIQGLTPTQTGLSYEDINKFGGAPASFSRQDLETREAYRQGWGSEALSGLGRVVTNTPLTMVGNAASILDLEDYFNQDKEVGNWLTNAMEDYKAKVNKDYFPIYRKTGESLDLGDSAWWAENASSLIESIGGYAATGAALAAGVGALLAAAPVSAAAAGVITTGVVALGLNQAEGISTGVQVYKDTYDNSLKKGLSEEASKQKAADAASYAINLNRTSIALNLTGANMFVRAPKLTRELVKNVSKLNTLKRTGLEAGQEFLEEEINLVAEKAGKAYGKDENFNLASGLDAVATKEGLEAGLLGALGGFGQTIATAGVNQLTGKTRDQQDRFKAQQDAIKEIEAIGKANKVPDSASTFKTAYDLGKLYKQLEVIDSVDNPSKELLAERKKLTDSILEVQAYNAFDTGTTDSLIQQYNSIKALTPEQAVAKGLHDNKTPLSNPDHYINKATKAVETINNLEKIYLDSLKYTNAKEVYLNRADDIALKNNRNERQAILNTNRIKAEADILGKIQSGKINLTRGGNTVFYNLDNLDENPFTTPAEKQLYEEVKNKIKEIPSVQEFENTKKEYDYLETEINKNDNEYTKATSEAAQKKAKQDAEDALNALKKAKEAAANKEAKAKADAERAVEQERIRKENLAKQEAAAEAKRQADAAAKAEAEAKRKADEAAKAAEEAAKGGVPPTPKPVVTPTPTAEPTLSATHPFVVNRYIDAIKEDSPDEASFIEGLGTLHSVAEETLEGDDLIEWNNYYNNVTSKPTSEAPEGGEPVSAEDAKKSAKQNKIKAAFEEFDIPAEQEAPKVKRTQSQKLKDRIEAITDLLEDTELNIETVTLGEIVQEINKLFDNDIEYTKKIFNDLKIIVGTIQQMSGNPEYTLTPTYTLSDEGVVITGPEVPPGAPTIFSQEGSVDANNKLMARVRENDPTLTFVIQGKKITSIASVASKAIGDEGTEVSEELGVFKTVYDEAGKLIFNSNQDAIVDTTFITEGTTITLKIEESTGDLEEDIDNAAIAMYVNTPEGERKIGYVHLPSYAGIQTLAQSEVLPSVQEQLALIKQFRQQVLENKDSILTTTVSKRGFGNVNKKGKGTNDIVPTLILSSAFANDPRVHLGVIGAIGENKKVYRQDQSIPLYGATEMEKGALVILLPHPSGTVVPYYAISNKLEADSRVNKLVAETIKDFLSGKITRKQTTTILERYVYTVPQGNIGATGIVVKDSDETGNRAVIINGQAVNPKSTTFEKTVGSVYFSANKNILIDPIKGKDYEIEIMNSNLVRTDVQANPVTYTNNQGEQVTENSYFHQVTTEFSTNLNKTAKPVTAVSNIEAKKAVIEKRRLEGTNLRGTTYKGETTEKDGLKVTKYSEFFSDGKRISKGGRIMLPAEFIEEYNITDQDSLDSLKGATEIRIYEVRIGKDGRSGISIQGTFPEGNIEMNVAGTELAALGSPVSNIDAKKADIEERREKSYETISFNYSTDDGYYGVYTNAKGETEIIESWDKGPVRKKLKAKYDAELEALKSQPTEEVNEEEEQARLQAIEDAKAFGFEIDDELEADIPTIFDTQNDISAEQLAAMKNNPSTLLIHPELNASTQNEAVLSIAYKALTIQPETEEVDGKEIITATNKELVKANFVEGARVLTNLAKTNPTNVAYAKAAKTMSIVAGDEVFEKLYAKASDFIKEIGFSTEESGFYNQMEAEEEVEEGEEKINQFIDEAASYEDRKTGASKRFKKFLAFIPAMEMIKGKPKTARNSLLLPTFNNYDSTFTMIANILSEYNYPSTADGLQLMINRLRAKDINNPVIIEVANKLEKAPQKIKVEFFNIFNQQHAKFKTLRLFWQKARTFKYFSQGQENKVKYAERLKPSLINSDRNKAQELVKEEMLTNFKQKGLILKSVISKLDRKTNNTTLEVNTAHNKAIYDQFLLALKDSGNYQADSAGKIKTEFLNETGFKTMYDLLSNTGVSISEKAFEDFLNNHLTQDGIRNQKAILGEVLGVIFKSLAGESKVGDVETEENIFQLNNPFYTESSSIGILARYEYNTRTDVFSSAFRHAGKSFYTFVRHTPLSELVLKLKNPWKANKKENAFIKGLIAMDPLARHSLWLNRMSNPTKTGDIAFTEAFNLYYEKGFRDSSEKGSTPKDLKDSIEKEHELNKVIDFQAQGNNTVVFHADTHSDKTTKALIQAVKHSINGYSGNIEEGIQLSDDTLNDLYSYFLGEYDRILQVNAQNEDPNFPENKKLKGYHASKGKPGLGSVFNIYYFLNSSVLKDTNPDLKTMLYDEQGNLQPISKENMAVVSNMIKEEINANFNNRFKKVKEDWGKLGLFFTETNKLGFSRLNVNSYMDAKYYNKVVEALGIQNKIVKNVTENFNQPAVDAEIQRILDYAIVDYAVNYAIATNEMLLITGDPAMHGKPSKDKGNIDSKSWVLKSIRDTFINVGKRNARLLASGNKGMFRKQKYNIGIIRDIQEVSEHVGDYISWLKDFEPEYLKKKFTPEMTNAQELTTVEEHLEVMLAYGKITDNQFKTLLGLYDPAAYRDVFGEEAPAYTQKEVIENLKTVMQPMKPVQVQSVLDPEIKANVQYYIKTSSFPIIPALVKGKPMESVLKQMKAASISRVTFPSAVKLGEHGTKDLFIDGKVNEELFKDNVIELDRDGFSIQLEVPYKENKKEVREGTQNMKLLFMDLPDSLILELAEGNKTIEESKREYTRLHKEIIDSALTKLLEDIGATVTENEFGGKEYKMEDFSKLSEILKEEGESRGYSINSLLGLDLNEEGQFKIPLTFNPNSAQIEPVITALLSNRLVKLKMPGKSYVLGSEVLTLEENISRKGKQTQADINIIKDIIWLSEEHKTQRKLKYYREVKGKPAMAQIIMPAYFLDKEGKQIDMTKFVKNGFLDTSKIDKELLQIMGFRIPTQGHNSMMMFEVVGFLPKTSGDLVIVPAEIESQMGSDYDVDKLYTYHYNYSIDEKSGKLKKYNKPGSIKTKQNRLIEIQSAIIMNKEVAPYIMNPLSMDDLADAIEKLNANKKSEWEGNYSTIYQRTTYFDNAAGQIGVGISANANTNHAAFQQANVYIKGTGIMFLKEDGTPYSDIEDNAYEGNSVTKYKDSRYTYLDPFTGEVIDNKENNKSAWRLDKIFTFDGKRISDIISQWLGASVDNAKEKLLGEGGINKYNFNTSLLIARAGFGNNWIIPFINQPILKEYYDILQKLEDSTEKSFEAGKKEKAIEGLFKKYMDLYALSNPNETPEIQGVSLKQLERSLNTEINANNAETQLAVLKAFLFYEALSGEIGAVQKALNTDVKGLPKNITETAEKRDYIREHGYSSSYLGNVEKIREKVISGAFMEIPRIASQLFGTKKDGTFVYAYDSPAYKWAKQALAEITKREFNSEQTNEIHNHIQQFIYTHPDFGLYGNDHAAEKQRLLFNENLADRLLLLQEKYPKNYFLSKISAVIDTNVDNPNKIKIVNTTAEQKIFIERMQQEWESAFYGEPELAKFAEDMAKYTMLFNSSQFGSSNLLKYLPFNYLNIIGAGKVLNGLELGDSMTLLNFVPQFLQHNPHYAPFAKEDNIAEKTAVYKKDADGKDTELIEAFSLPSLATEFDKNPAKNLIQTIKVDGESVFIYPKYVSMYGGAELGRILFVKSGEGNYKRVDTLGSTDFTEYNAKQNGLASTVIKEQKGIINVNAQTQTIDATSSDLEEVYFRNPTVHSLLESIIYRNSFSENPLNKAYGALAEKLLEQPENGYKVIVEEKMVAAGSHNSTTKLLKFNKEFLLSVGELQLQRTVLHEIVHKETVSKLSDPKFLKETKEGKAILKVYESFQTQIQNRALTDSEKTRSIPNELISAELFKILVDNTFGEVKRDLNITTLTKLNTADINSPAFKELMQLFSTNLSKIERFKASSKLEPGSERYEAVANYIKETFTPANINSLKTKYYAYSSILEFATEALTNKQTQEYLKTFTTINQKGEKVTLWKQFIDALTSLLNFDNVNRTLAEDAVETIIDVIDYGKPAKVITPPQSGISTTTPLGERITAGVYVNQEGLSPEEELELFSLIKPILEKQAVKSNKGAAAPKMAGLGLNWDYLNGVTKRREKGFEKIDIKDPLVRNSTYGWFTLSSTGEKLSPITGRMVELMTKATGIDVTNYDGSIINIYNANSFIGNHPDIDESQTASKYPVVVVNIGGPGNIIMGTDKQALPPIKLKSGAGYVFGFEGKNRVIPHSTYASPINGTLPAITTEMDGQTLPAGSYRVSITMRRVRPLEPGMPEMPATVIIQPQVKETKIETKEVILKYFGAYYKYNIDKDGNQVGASLYSQNGVDYISTSRDYASIIASNNYTNVTTGEVFGKPTEPVIIPKEEGNNAKYELFPGVFANEGQKEALDKLDSFMASTGKENEAFVLVGRGGTGKTTIIKKMLSKFPSKKIGGATIAHSAKDILGSSLGKDNVSTIASLLRIKLDETTGKFEPDEYGRSRYGIPIEKLDVVIIDECSMVSDALFEEIMKHKKPSAKIIFMGDNVQLPPIGQDTDSITFRANKNPNNFAKLTEPMRFSAENPIFALSYIIADNVEAPESKIYAIPTTSRITTLKEDTGVIFTNKEETALAMMVEDIKQEVEKETPNVKAVKAVTFNNELNAAQQSVKNLNIKIRQKLWGEEAKNQFNVNELLTAYDSFGGEAPKFNNAENLIVKKVSKIQEVEYRITAPMGIPAPAPMTFKTIYLTLQTKDGNILSEIPVIAEEDQERFKKQVAIYKSNPNGKIKSLGYRLEEQVANLQYGYAITAHKAQGSTYTNVYVFEDNILGKSNLSSPKDKNRALYTAITRASKKLVLMGMFNINNEMNNLNDIDIFSTFDDEILDKQIKACE